MNGKKEFGDWQTPCDFAKRVCNFLKTKKYVVPNAIVEPTCGVGNFLKASLCFDAKKIIGIELNPQYAVECEKINNQRIQIFNENFFAFDFEKIPCELRDNVLILGNPPWVTNSELSAMGSKNLPRKNNIKNLNGLEAMTGGGNFDIAESIILKLVQEFSRTNSTIALLCKTSVARKVFQEIHNKRLNCAEFSIYEFDAKKIFEISASACLLFIRLSKEKSAVEKCSVFDFEKPNSEKYSFGFVNKKFYSNIKSDIPDFDGKCCFEWRQGVKHDLSKIMELEKVGGKFFNGNGDSLDIESDLVFPLVKSSGFKQAVINDFSKYVIVTQRKIGEETFHIKNDFPKTWKYLSENAELFAKRKSSIYKNAPQFAMFGIGDYSYSRYKVGISGFYKEPLFSLLCSDDACPVMVDDTSYFLSFDNFEQAYITMLFLNCKKTKIFLKAVSFADSKRPFTKKVLERLDFEKMLSAINLSEILETEKQFFGKNICSEKMMATFRKMPIFNEPMLFKIA